MGARHLKDDKTSKYQAIFKIHIWGYVELTRVTFDLNVGFGHLRLNFDIASL